MKAEETHKKQQAERAAAGYPEPLPLLKKAKTSFGGNSPNRLQNLMGAGI